MSLLIFFVVLSVLVLCHEAGHYISARIFGVKAEEFGFGFPPRALGFVKAANIWKRIGVRDKNSYPGTIWSINWLPLGGFVRLKGEQGESRAADSFAGKSLAARAVILAAGVGMNWILAWVIFSVGFTIGVPIQTDNLPASAIINERRIQISQVLKDSPAAKAGLEEGDSILQVDEVPVVGISQTQEELANRSAEGGSVKLTIKHSDQTIVVETNPEYLEPLKRSGWGIGLIEVGRVRFPWYQAIGQGAQITFEYTRLIFNAFGGLLSDLFLRQRVSGDLSGPVGIAVMTGEIAEQGVWAVAQFAALLSINLALINIFPIPALDGGRLLFVAIEAVRRKPSHPRLEAFIHQAGFLLLLILIILVTLHDVQQYREMIWRGITSIVR